MLKGFIGVTRRGNYSKWLLSLILDILAALASIIYIVTSITLASHKDDGAIDGIGGHNNNNNKNGLLQMSVSSSSSSSSSAAAVVVDDQQQMQQQQQQQQQQRQHAEVPSIAVVMPFVPLQISKVHRNLMEWNRYNPCHHHDNDINTNTDSPPTPTPTSTSSTSTTQMPVHMIFYVSYDINDTTILDESSITSNINNIWNNELNDNVRSCFIHMTVLYFPQNDMGHIEGACRTFYSQFDR
jgi:hypothetical protein